MTIHLFAFGGLRARSEAGDLERLLGQRVRAALLLYLAVERSASREALAALFWPESNSENARHALRQSLYHLRSELGDHWVEGRTHELRATDEVEVDARQFEDAVARRDHESAAKLYAGPFLDGVNLIDVAPWERWVDLRRAEYARNFRRVCREWLEERRAVGDVDGAIEAARRWVTPDPLDDEAQHRLIALLAESGDRIGAIRQFETYEKLLAAEELPALPETMAFVDRLRGDSITVSPLESASEREATAPRPTYLEPVPVSDAGLRRRRSLIFLVAAAIVLVFVSGAVAVDAWQSTRAQAASSQVLAVLPFEVRGSGDATFLREGLVSLLATALDGSQVRTVDSRAVLALAARSDTGAPTIDRARRISQRLDAGLFLLGDVVQAGARLQIEAAVYRAEVGGEALSRATVTGVPDSLFAMVDDLSARLLADLAGGRRVRLIRTAATTTTSLGAFKEYLEGEADLRAGRFERAADAFIRATSIDSTFAIAHYRLALARDWAASGRSEEPARAAARHADRLAPRERALIEALQAYHEGQTAEAERRYRAILSRYPEELEAWIQLAEVLFHFGPAIGRPIAESEGAWRTVLSYEPRNLWAMLHLARVAAWAGRVAALDSMLAGFSPAEVAADRRLVQVALLRAAGKRDTAATLSLAKSVRDWEDPALYQLAAYLTGFSDEPSVVRVLLREFLDWRREPTLAAELRWHVALTYAANGKMSAARELLADLVRERSERDQTASRVAESWMATLPTPLNDSALARIRSAMRASRLDPVGDDEDSDVTPPIWLALDDETFATRDRRDGLRLYTDGVLSLRLEDLADARRSSASLRELARSSTDPVVRSFDRALRSRLTWRDRGAAEALRLLDEMEDPKASVGALNIVPFLARAHERYLRGELLVALGRDADALRSFASLAGLSIPETAFRAPAALRQAEIHERLGNRAAAAEHYSRVIELWGDGDAEVQPVVAAARRRLAALSP